MILSLEVAEDRQQSSPKASHRDMNQHGIMEEIIKVSNNSNVFHVEMLPNILLRAA